MNFVKTKSVRKNIVVKPVNDETVKQIMRKYEGISYSGVINVLIETYRESEGFKK